MPRTGPPATRPVQLFLKAGPAGSVVCDVGGVTEPDIGTVAILARLLLAARRLGRPFLLLHASEELRGLLVLVGLSDVVPCATDLTVELKRQSEEREEPRGVEEEGDPRDAAP